MHSQLGLNLTGAGANRISGSQPKVPGISFMSPMQDEIWCA